MPDCKQLGWALGEMALSLAAAMVATAVELNRHAGEGRLDSQALTKQRLGGAETRGATGALPRETSPTQGGALVTRYGRQGRAWRPGPPAPSRTSLAVASSTPLGQQRLSGSLTVELNLPPPTPISMVSPSCIAPRPRWLVPTKSTSPGLTSSIAATYSINSVMEWARSSVL